MNLERIRAERERTRKVKVVDVKVEKKVFVPSSVSVGRLADIFGVKICKSYRTMRDQLTSLVNLQRTMQRLGLSEDQRRSDHREYCHFRDLTFSDD
jgi:translation initiation factor IF-2